ncbi:ATP-binding protein [Streptomyces sp. NPDC051940]|uniref:ATP-binding protein n=1 Tax=Streptomyces sp. NPDC051940 TaxID=3155675 RepID=UPI00344ABD3A
MTSASASAVPPELPGLTELRLSAFKGHRRRTLRLDPVTVLAGSGKTSALQACEALARMAGGDQLDECFGAVPGGARGCIPRQARPDAGGRRGFRIGVSAGGPLGEVRLDVAVQAEPELRIVGERLTGAGHQLFSTALRDPGRRQVQAGWRTAGAVPVTRAPLPDDRLGTALLPLRVAGRTEGERLVLAAAEQVVVALRSLFPCEPRPAAMRAPVLPDAGALLPDCGNLAGVLRRVRDACATRHGLLVDAVRDGCGGRVYDVCAEELPGGAVRAVLDRGDPYGCSPLEDLGDGELRYVALALVLLSGPEVRAVEPDAETPGSCPALTVLADGLDRALSTGQHTALLRLAARTAAGGRVRLLGAVAAAGEARTVRGITVVDLGHDEP